MQTDTVNQQQTGIGTDRATVAARIASLRAEQLKGLPALRKAEDEARVRWEAAQKALEAAATAYNQAAGASSTASFARSNAIAKLEAELRSSADGSISVFASEMNALYERERKEDSRGRRTPSGQLDPRTGRQLDRIESDRPSRVRRLLAIVAARREATDVVSLEVHDEASLARRLQALRDGLPEIVIEDVTTQAA